MVYRYKLSYGIVCVAAIYFYITQAMNDACVYDGLLNREGGGGCLANSLLLFMLLQQQTKGNNVAKYIYKPALQVDLATTFLGICCSQQPTHIYTWPKAPFT